MKSADYWLGKLSKLPVDRASGDPAPDKPLLLLVIFEPRAGGIASAQDAASDAGLGLALHVVFRRGRQRARATAGRLLSVSSSWQ